MSESESESGNDTTTKNKLDSSIADDYEFNKMGMRISKQLSTANFAMCHIYDPIAGHMYSAYLGQGCRLDVWFPNDKDEYTFTSYSSESNTVDVIYSTPDWKSMVSYVIKHISEHYD